ncbi:GGDEF domain-containing protein [Kitasatospora acidiphila]|uniref:GGDEF domain-containing protein n=1 Tax=Kitasatospora acidiphila TaxID=2567942 RepID=UPI003C770FA6
MHPITLPAQHRLTALAAALPLAAGWALHTALYRRRLEQARRDPLTNLPTRDLFTARAEKLTHHPDATVLVIDLDKFKEVNDSFGHQAGDAVLFAAAHQLDQWTGRAGVAGRIGGDEFAAVVTIAPDQLTARLDELTSALHQPLTWQGQRIGRGASIGAARLTGLPEPTVGAALTAADAAMYTAKHGLRGWHQHTPTDAVEPRRWRRNRPHPNTTSDGAAPDNGHDADWLR